MEEKNNTDVTVTQSNQAMMLEKVLMEGDLSKLSPEQRVSYYNSTCESLGLNKLTRPFDYIRLNGKLTLYAKRDCTDQLRKIHKVSIEITSRELKGDVFIVSAKATSDQRTDESIGAVCIANLRGDILANAYMKAETKAKRRVTLSICGLGILDETEADTISDAEVIADGQDTVTRKLPLNIVNLPQSNSQTNPHGDWDKARDSWENEPATDPQRKKLWAMTKEHGMDASQSQDFLFHLFGDALIGDDGKIHSSKLTKGMIREAFERLEEMK